MLHFVLVISDSVTGRKSSFCAVSLLSKPHVHLTTECLLQTPEASKARPRVVFSLCKLPAPAQAPELKDSRGTSDQYEVIHRLLLRASRIRLKMAKKMLLLPSEKSPLAAEARELRVYISLPNAPTQHVRWCFHRESLPFPLHVASAAESASWSQHECLRRRNRHSSTLLRPPQVSAISAAHAQVNSPPAKHTPATHSRTSSPTMSSISSEQYQVMYTLRLARRTRRPGVLTAYEASALEAGCACPRKPGFISLESRALMFPVVEQDGPDAGGTGRLHEIPTERQVARGCGWPRGSVGDGWCLEDCSTGQSCGCHGHRRYVGFGTCWWQALTVCV
jgi:hypothetical protein